MFLAVPRDRVMAVALSISFLFHLSMVTLFRIVIYFPQEPIVYYDLIITEAKPDSDIAQDLQQSLEYPSPEDIAERLGEGTSTENRWTGLPRVTLPTLQFSELDLVRLSQTGLKTRSRYEELFEKEADDLWARFGRKLSSMGDILHSSSSPGKSATQTSRRVLAGRPAPGFEAYLEWMNSPYDRQPLIVQKIEALWGADKSVLSEPLVLVFRVNREGRVTFVQMPIEDDDGIVVSAAKAILRYRFEALPDDGPDNQHATLIIQAEDKMR